MNVLLAGGGSSHERQVSLKTTDAMENALQELGLNYRRVEVKDELDVVTFWEDRFDILLLGFHGRRGEDGLLQAFLERHGIPYTGADAAASQLAFSKVTSKRLFLEAGVPTPKWEFFLHEPHAPLPKGKLQYPYVIKPDNEGSTIGLSVCRNEADFIRAQEISGPFNRLLYESFIPGREVTVGVLGGKALPVVEIFPGHDLYDYESKYTKGASRYECPAQLDPSTNNLLQTFAVKAMKALGVSVYGRVDFRLDADGTAWCLEVNTLPGMTETSLLPMAANAIGMSFPELIERILRESSRLKIED